MKRTYLGEFEELVLLTVAVLQGEAYGVVLLHELIAQTGRSLRLNQVHSALQQISIHPRSVGLHQTLCHQT